MQEVLIRRISVGTVFKLVGVGLMFSLLPFTILMGCGAALGLNTLNWNNQPLTGWVALVASPFIGLFLVAMFTMFLGTATAFAQARPVLRAGDQKGNLRALLEAARGLDGLAYDIQWSEFPAAAPLAEALNAGAVDSGPIGDAPLIFALAAGTRIKAIGVNRSDPYGTAVLVRPDSPLKTAADLKGRSVATNRGSIGHFVALKAAASAGLKPSDIELRFLPPAEAKLALVQGSVDAWATWEPYTALAETSGHARVLASGRGLWSGLSYLAATDAALAAKRDVLRDFHRRVVRALPDGRAGDRGDRRRVGRPTEGGQDRR